MTKDTPIRDELIEHLRIERVKRRLTLDQVAQAAGLTPGRLAKLETHKGKASPEEIGRIARVFDLELALIPRVSMQ